MHSVDKPRIPQSLTVHDDPDRLFDDELEVEGVSLIGTTLTSDHLDRHSIGESVLTKVDLTDVEVEKISFTDIELKGCIFSGNKFTEAYWLRVAVKSSRCAGIDMNESIVRNVSFSDSKIEFLNFRKAKLEDILFKDCMLSDIDFNLASLKNVRFENCVLTDVTFNGAKMINVDISRSTIEHIKGVESIKGVTISREQLLQLAPSLAIEAGIKIDPNS